MGSDDAMSCLGNNSLDLYSKIKLRGLNGKVNGSRYGNLGLYNMKPMSSGSKNSKASAGKKSGTIGKRECKITAINSGRELATNKGNSQGHKRSWLAAFREGSRKGVNSETGRSSEEETAIEVLSSFKVTRSETMASEFKVGDLVWGKIETYPWWPGYIYNEALAESAVMRTKIEGFLLVSFFGDDTYSWIHPKDLIPYELHFLSKSKQLKSEIFKKAVDDSIDEVRKREEFALTCQYRKHYNGNEEGPTYSVDQVGRFRREFKPAEMVSFLHKTALGPKDLIRDGRSERNIARVLAYRKAVFAEDSSPYKEAYASPDGWFNGDSNARKEALRQGAARSNISERAEVPAPKAKRKGSLSGYYRSDKTHDKIKCAKFEEAVDGRNLSKTDCGKASRDHVSINRSKYHQRNQDAFLDKESHISKSSKSPSSILLVEMAVGESVKDPPPKIRIEGKELASLKDTEADLSKPEAMLHIKFPPQALMPSTSELRAKFARFGRLNTSATYSSWKSSECHVSFKKASAAESAREHLHRHRDMYNNTKVMCYLESGEITPSLKSPKSPNLLGKSFTDPTPHSRSEGGKKSTLLLSEVNRQEGQTEKYQQTIPPLLPPPGLVFPEVSSQQALSPLIEDKNKKLLDNYQTAPTSTTTATTTSSVDLSAPMLKLLKEIDNYFEDLKRTQKHWLYGDCKKV